MPIDPKILLTGRIRRDINIDRTKKYLYSFLASKFDTDNRHIFFLSMRAGLFYEKKINLKNRQALFNFPTPEDIEEMIFVYYYDTKGNIKNNIFPASEVLSTAERYANGGIDKLFGLFSNKEKSDYRVIEDLLDLLETTLNN